MAERLEIDLVKRLEDFRLAVRLTVATEILVMFGPSGGKEPDPQQPCRIDET